jgi:hypothetical protein
MRAAVLSAIVCVWLGGLVTACVTPATEDEIQTMCDNLVQLRGEIENPSVETIVSHITVRLNEHRTQIQDTKTREKRMLDEEMQASLDEAEKDEDKEKIRKEFKAKIQALEAKYKPELEAIDAKKKEANAAAKKKAEENRAVWDEAVNECVTRAKKEGVSQQIANCRIQADSTDKYWNGCR